MESHYRVLAVNEEEATKLAIQKYMCADDIWEWTRPVLGDGGNQQKKGPGENNS